MLLDYEVEIAHYDREKTRLRELWELEDDESRKNEAKALYQEFLQLPVPQKVLKS